MILYFIGTCNSRYIAEGLAELCDDELVAINSYLKKSERINLDSDKPFVFVMPIYAFRIPKKIDEFIRNCKYHGSKEAYFIVNCGGSPGDALRYIKKTAKAAGLNLKGFDAINMPSNYILLYNPPATDSNAVLGALKYQKTQIETIANDINNNKEFFKRPAGIVDKLKSLIINPIFMRTIKPEKFEVSDLCNNCGQCVVRCPLNNVVFDGFPKWGDDCMACMACISGCPFNAIEYGSKTIGRNRYFLDKHYDDIE